MKDTNIGSKLWMGFCRIMALLVGLSVNFDFFTVGGVSIVSIIIVLYCSFVIIPFRVCADPNNGGRFSRLPLLYLLLLIILNIINTNEVNNSILPIGFLFCIILYCITLVHVERDIKVIGFFLCGLGLSGVIMSICFYLGIGVEYEGGRLQMFGSNSNNLGCLLCVSLAIILYKVIIKDCFKLKILRYIFTLCLLPIIGLIFFTASRTALIITVLIILLCFVEFIKNQKSQMTKILCLIVFVSGLYMIYKAIDDVAEYEVLYTRVVEMGEDDNMDYSSGRTSIWEYLIDVAIQHPFGVGQTGYSLIAKKVFGSTNIDGEASPHNVPLEIYLYTGIIGFAIMFCFFAKILKNAWIYFRNNNDLILIFIVSVFYVQMMFGQILVFRNAWICSAIIAGSSLHYYRRIRPLIPIRK